jgi:ADP-heptose:LPS heptosyltransferase
VGRVNRRRDRWLKRGLERLLRPFFRRPRLTLEEIRAGDPRRILLVRQHNQMGDMLCAVPAFRAVRQTFPGARTLLVTAPVNDGVVRGNPYLDEVLLFDKVAVRRSPRAALRFLRELRAFRADLAVVLNTVSYSGTSSWIAVLSGARWIIGGDSRPFGWSFSIWLYNLQMPTEPEVVGHAIDHGLRPLREVGFRIGDRSTVLVPDETDHRAAADFLATAGPPPWVALHPGAGKEANRWPASHFAAAAARLEEAGFSPFLVEGPTDAAATAATQAARTRPLPVLRGVSVRVVGAALERCALALVNDTGVMHVAGAVGTPTLALFGPTPAASWKPPGEHVTALQSPDGTMEGLGLETVEAALRPLMDAARAPGGDRAARGGAGAGGT